MRTAYHARQIPTGLNRPRPDVLFDPLARVGRSLKKFSIIFAKLVDFAVVRSSFD
jgi:hypothetical protein